MFFLLIILFILFYILIGFLLSLLWVDTAIKNAGVKNFDSLAYMLRCGFFWPWMIFDKNKRR